MSSVFEYWTFFANLTGWDVFELPINLNSLCTPVKADFETHRLLKSPRFNLKFT